MELTDLGFDHWFEAKQSALKRPDCVAARVTRVDRERYLVRNQLGEVHAELTGKLLFATEASQDIPCVGDWVLVQYHNAGELAIVHVMLPRKSFLRRKSPGKNVDYQMIASNIDTAFIVQSCDHDFNLRRLERYFVMAHEGHIAPVVLLSKSDLIKADELEGLIAAIQETQPHARVIPLSNVTLSGLEALQGQLEKGKTYCLLGSSGVGKTSLVNRLLGREVFETFPVREKDSRGRHTTARRQMIVLESGALLIDTPGMRELGLIDAGESIEDQFADIHELAAKCHFKDCTHTSETGCAILHAIHAGELDEDRYRGYLKLKKESDFHQLTYAERRKKDRQFGRMVKSVKKHMRKK